MIEGLYSALSALNASETRQNVTANNMANMSTPGYKVKVSNLGDINGGGVNVISVDSIDGTSYLINTGNNLDLSINGNGYFRLNDNNSLPVLTRNGSFRVDGENRIVDPQGNILFQLPQNLNSQDMNNLNIDKDGNIFNDQNNLGTLDIVDKYGNIRPTGTYEILNGYLEASNVDIAKEIVDSMINLRYLQANVKTVQTNDEMLGNIIDLKR
jgi:flagellar basal body rod protein FlgG